MPGITIFNRRWNVASDDLFFPGLIELIFRFVWLVPQLVYYVKYQESFQCSDVTLLHVYFLGYLCIMIAIVFIQFFIVQISSRGTITNVAPRRHINKFLYARTCLVCTEFVWSCIGCIWLSKTKWNVCSYIVYFAVLANIIFFAIALILLLVILVFIFDPISHLPEGDVKRKNILYEWLRTIFCCCWCCLYTGNSRSPHYENSYKQISSLLEHLFRGGNMTPSDVLAGIILKSKKEPDQYDREFLHFKKSQTMSGSVRANKQLRIEQIPKWMTVNEACYYIKYAVATYTWPYYLYMHNIRGFCDLCCSPKNYLCPCCCPRTAQTATLRPNLDEPNGHLIIQGDVRSGRHMKAFKFLSKVDECDLLYANFENDLFLSPFCVLVDHFKKPIVITIRGTLSMRDVITDLNAGVGYFNVDHLTNQACHLGILNNADNVYNRIKSHNLLDEAFRANPSYQLLVTGHSLGAGTAVILALKLKSEYPNIKCIAFSPPGGLISQHLAEYTRSFVMSVVIGDDIVPRLSVHSVHNLKADILKEIYSTSLPKYKIIWKYSMSFVKSNPTNPQTQQQIESDDDALSSIESVTAPTHNDLDTSLNSATSRNLLLEFDSGSESQNHHNIGNSSKPSNLLDIQETTSNSEMIAIINETNNITSLTNATQVAIRNENRKTRHAARASVLQLTASINNNQTDRDFNESNDESIQKQSIVGLHTAKELMNKVYDTYIELELPGNILYIYQIHPNRALKTGWCSFCRNSCACLWSSSRNSSRFIQYDSRWATNDEFKRILITNRMLMDHFPNTVEDALSYFNTTDRIV